MKKGDHLVVSRLGYTHHGLYVGDGSVIHYSGLASDLSSGVVEQIDLESFANGSEVGVRHYKRRTYSRQKSVDRAYSRLGEDDYNVILNNCEHFVTWCITGSHSSRQVKSVVASVASVSCANPLTQTLVRAAPLLICDQAGPGVARLAAGEVGRTALASLAKSVVPTATGVAVGVASGAGAASAPGLLAMAGAVGVGSLSTTVLAPAVVVAGVCYGVSKLFSWFGD